MKKILIGFALGASMLSFAQQYPDYGGGNDGYYQNDGGYYSDQDDQNYFPDDYYYNYPQDYYPGDYYRNNYNDYRNSVVSINWNVFFNQNRLAPWQVDQIIRLNNLYSSFSAWNNFYRYNPDRWYYDRFYALERIMGPRVFVVFQNNYYRGYSPVTYFQDYRRVHYAGICRPVPRYRNVNINIYRVDRNNFRRTDNPTFNIVRSQRPDNGFRDSGYGNNNGGFRSRPEIRGNNNSGVRSDNGGVRGNGGFRGNNNGAGNNNGGFRAEGNSNGGFRNGTGGFRGNSGIRREEAPSRENNGGFRNNNEGFRGNTGIRREEAPRRENNGGFRNEGGFRRSENSAPREQNRGGNEGRGTGGFRTGLVKN